jgi:hypothetical protein
MWTCQPCGAWNMDWHNVCGKCTSHRKIGDGYLRCDTCQHQATTTRTINSLGRIVTIYYCHPCAEAFDVRRTERAGMNHASTGDEIIAQAREVRVTVTLPAENVRR